MASNCTARKKWCTLSFSLLIGSFLSTCRCSEGLHEDLKYIYNHQSCESVGHHLTAELYQKAVSDPWEYRKAIAKKHGLPADKCDTLGTAANMNNVALSHRKFHELEVVAVCTGGVNANACRAGDPASYNQIGDTFEVLKLPKEGTINTIPLINKELTPGAMVGAVITATEAKTAALQELMVPSRYSDGLATGTGTDQMAIASFLGGFPLNDAGTHSKLGELIGQTVHDAVKKTLAFQNGLSPLRQCSSLAHLERMGTIQEEMCQGIGAFLDEEQAHLLEINFFNIDKDPLTVAVVAAFLHLLDEFAWGILPENNLVEVMCNYGAQISAAVSGKHHRLPIYREKLSLDKFTYEKQELLRFVYHAFAMGFDEKWRDFKDDWQHNQNYETIDKHTH